MNRVTTVTFVMVDAAFFVIRFLRGRRMFSPVMARVLAEYAPVSVVFRFSSALDEIKPALESRGDIVI
jgi:hypothetical protein